GGVVLALFLLPNIITVMSSFFPDDIAQVGQLFTAIEYYNFVFRTLVIVGIGFVTPVFIVALNLAGVIRGKQVILAWRWVLIVCLVFGMLVSPPADVITMVLVASILFVLYMLAALLCVLFDWRRRKKNPDLFVDVD
ncbi:MAG: twin-arginine translocase subunit TatC, partial [Microbacterium gubbeenense]